jgi:hypothetical protein
VPPRPRGRGRRPPRTISKASVRVPRSGRCGRRAAGGPARGQVQARQLGKHGVEHLGGLLPRGLRGVAHLCGVGLDGVDEPGPRRPRRDAASPGPVAGTRRRPGPHPARLGARRASSSRRRAPVDPASGSPGGLRRARSPCRSMMARPGRVHNRPPRGGRTGLMAPGAGAPEAMRAAWGGGHVRGREHGRRGQRRAGTGSASGSGSASMADSGALPHAARSTTTTAATTTASTPK